MTQTTIINAQVRAGIWEAEATGPADHHPGITVVHQGRPLAAVTCTYDTVRSLWRVTAPIPAEFINDGVQSFAVMDASGRTIHHFTLQTGASLGDDLSAEVALLRNELDLLKAAFRRHCNQS